MKIFPSRTLIDRIGIALSTTCAIHCLLMPILIMITSVGALSWLANEHVESVLLLLAIILAVNSLISGCLVHRQFSILLFLPLAIAFIGTGRWAGLSVWETPLVVVGGFLLAISHYGNLRLCRSCSACE